LRRRLALLAAALFESLQAEDADPDRSFAPMIPDRARVPD
jgi:hypothetical protein